MDLEQALARVTELEAANAALTTKNAELIEQQVDSIMSAREKDAANLCERLGLASDEVEINFAEAGEDEKTLKTNWKQLLVSLSEEQYAAFTELAKRKTDDSGLSFSEFDTPETNGKIDLSEGSPESKSLRDRLKAARRAAAANYSKGSN